MRLGLSGSGVGLRLAAGMRISEETTPEIVRHGLTGSS
jgi:hypothetical protein